MVKLVVDAGISESVRGQPELQIILEFTLCSYNEKSCCAMQKGLRKVASTDGCSHRGRLNCDRVILNL